MKALLILLIFLLSSCETKSVYKHHGSSSIEANFLKSQQVLSNRKALLNETTLDQKADLFEKYILKRMHPKYMLAPKLYIEGKPGKLRMDMTALFLSALAYKFACSKAPQDKLKIIKSIESIIEADRSNGLDGFIPYQMTIKNDKIQSFRNDTHINVYTQLLFAYIPLLKLSNDEDIKNKVLEHLDLIIKHLQRTNFQLVDHLGKEIEYSDLSPSRFTLQTNRQQLLLVFVDLALKYKLGKNIQKTRSLIKDYGYENDIQSMHFKFLNLEFPTHSSSWLNLMNSYIGYHIDNAEYFKNAYLSLYHHYEDEKNLLFILMLESMQADKENLIQAEKILNEFPANPTNHEVINSLDENLDIIKNAPFVKLKRELEVKEPLPIYKRPMRSFEWKLNQMRVDGNFKSKGQFTYTGIDYLIAYWMLKWLQKDMNDQI